MLAIIIGIIFKIFFFNIIAYLWDLHISYFFMNEFFWSYERMNWNFRVIYQQLVKEEKRQFKEKEDNTGTLLNSYGLMSIDPIYQNMRMKL